MPTAVDFETYYDKQYSLTTLGVDAYCADPRFDPYLVAIVDPARCLRYVGHPAKAPWHWLNGQVALAHNARFDEVVFKEAQKRGIISGEDGPASWRCTADLSVFKSAPRSLADASRILLDRTLDKATRKEMEGKTAKAQAAAGMTQEVIDYAYMDAFSCWSLDDKFSPDWPDHEKRISELNRACGVRGVHIDQELLERNLGDLATLKWKAARLIPWEWDSTPLSHIKLREACRDANIPAPASLAADSEDCIQWENTYGEAFPWVGAMRDWRRVNILEKRLQTIQRRLRPDGSFPFAIKYFGAHTGRFSGEGGFNMQNMPRGEMFGVDLRRHFIARPGKTFIIADLAQIEARLLLYLAGDWDTLRLVAQGLSVYEAHAIQTMNHDPKTGTLKQVNPDLYRLAKARVLGLGYGCGEKKFSTVARIMAGVILSDGEAKAVVDDYRDRNPKVTALWNSLQSALIRSNNDDLELELPSGRVLTYFNVCGIQENGRKGWSAEIVRGTRREKTYGGRLTENLVQALARDVFTYDWLQLVDLGLPPLWHVHDEFIIEVDEEDAEVAQEAIDRTLATPPPWLQGCPLGAESHISKVYLK